jgi:hypothetical protein
MGAVSTTSRRGSYLLAALLSALLLVAVVAIPARGAGFGFSAVDGQVSDANGNPYTQAGGHPYAVSVQIQLHHHLDTDPIDLFTTIAGGQVPDGGNAKDILTTLPPGLIGDPSALPKCTSAQLAGGGVGNGIGIGTEPTCPIDSQVGVVTLLTSMTNPFGAIWGGTFPLYNMEARPSVPASFGFQASGTPIVLDATLRSDGDYGLTVSSRDVPATVRLWGLNATFWGVPADPSHDAYRCDYGSLGFLTTCDGGQPPVPAQEPHSAGLPPVAFLRLPTRCTSPGAGLSFSFSIDTWENPGVFVTDSFFTHQAPFFPDPAAPGPQQGLTGCDLVPFDPTLSATPSSPTRAATPSGFRFELQMPQSDDPAGIGQADLKKAVVTLPEGVRVSPSSADGLGACSSAQIGLLGTGFADPSPIRFNTVDPSCPDSAKLGTVTLTTPLLEKPLTGSVYLAAPFDNPFQTLLAMYIVVKGQGILLKLPGKIAADPVTGQITTTFDNSPQTPFSDLQLDFNGGPRAALVTPPECGTYTTRAVLTSWSGAVVPSDSHFTLAQGPNGVPCAARGFAPSFKAGPQDQGAGRDGRFGLEVTREDTDQELGSIAVDMPAGLTGRIANAVLCPDSAAAAGTCQDVSRVGSVTVGAGAGSDPFWITSGGAYITGPYKGAAFGLSIVVPAVAGPFNLGDVVVRSALFVDRHTTALNVVSDPLPTVLQGIRLDVRDVRVEVDRPHFIVNPTSCALKQVAGTIASVAGAVAHRSWRFQMSGCNSLPFAPRMSLTVGGRGHTRSGGSTPLTTTLTQTPGQANLRVVSVTLPTTLNALLPVLNRACTQAQFAAGHCGGARAGSAVAVTPLLRDPLRGSAYFVRGPRVLPDLVIALRGQVAVDLVGKVGVNPRTNQLTTRFDTIPDVAIKKFTLRLLAGPNDPLGTTANLCSAKAKRAVASIGFRGQNGKVLNVRQRLRIRGCPRRR